MMEVFGGSNLVKLFFFAMLDIMLVLSLCVVTSVLSSSVSKRYGIGVLSRGVSATLKVWSYTSLQEKKSFLHSPESCRIDPFAYFTLTAPRGRGKEHFTEMEGSKVHPVHEFLVLFNFFITRQWRKNILRYNIPLVLIKNTFQVFMSYIPK